jgi:hypothetical protein
MWADARRSTETLDLRMEWLITVFWVAVYVGVPILKRSPNSRLSRLAFTWIGPHPAPGERWSTFRLRWSIYSVWWLVHIAAVFSVLWIAVRHWPSIANQMWWQALWFALPLGAGMALLAAVGFLISWGKARLVGPNPTFGPGRPRSPQV